MARLSSLVQCAFALALLGDVAARSASKYYQMTPGDVMIGGLYSIHDGGTDYSNCTGAIDETFVILSEAHLLSLDYVNEKVLASINMTMGTRMWDTCNSAAITLQHCVNFIDTTEQKDHGICGPTVNLTTSSYSAAPTEYDYDSMGVLAVTGAFWSSVAKNINYLMQAFCIPVVGTMSSSSEFDDQSRYPYFLRTCASDKYRAQVIFDTLQARGWLHATVLYSPYDSSFALKKEFQTLVDACSPTSADLRLFRPPCIERYIELQFEGNDDDESESQLTAQLEALRYLLNDGGPRVMLLLMPVNAITRLFEKLEEWGYHGNDLQFVVANGIEFDHDKRWNAFMNNTLSIENSLPDWAMLKQRLETITLQATNNTWLKELIVKQNDCCFSDSEIGSPFCSVERRPLCSGDEKLLSVPSVALKKARLIFEAINVIAHSVKAVHFELCGNNTVGYCSAMKKEITGRLLFENMLESSFEEDDHRTFEFFKVGKNRITNSGMPIFDVYQFQGDDWRVIQVAYNPFVGPGSTTDASQSANFSQYAIYEMIRPPLWDELARECDECQTECVRSYAYMKPGDQCCWTCRECENSFEIVNVTLQQCEMCPENTIPDEENRTQCVPVDSVSFVAKPNGLLVVLLGLSIVGALLSVFAGVFIHRHRKTPMARASTPDLCFAQAGCLLFMFLSTSLMLPTSSAFVCGFSWALSTTLLALCHAISTVKALRISRPIFYTRLVSHMTHTQSSTAMISAAMLCHCLIAGLWLALRPPTIHHDRLLEETGYYDWCSSSSEPQTIILFIVPIGLLCLSALFLRRGLRNMYMFQVRQTRIAFAGSLCFFANYAILLPFIFVQDHTDIMLESVMLMCVPMLTGFVSWFTMLFPVIYVLLFKSRQNRREYITRERSHQFTEGNMMYFVDAVILKNSGKNRTRAMSIERINKLAHRME